MLLPLGTRQERDTGVKEDDQSGHVRGVQKNQMPSDPD